MIGGKVVWTGAEFERLMATTKQLPMEEDNNVLLQAAEELAKVVRVYSITQDNNCFTCSTQVTSVCLGPNVCNNVVKN